MKKVKTARKTAPKGRAKPAAKSPRAVKATRRSIDPAAEATGTILRSAVSDLAMIADELRELVIEMRAMMRRDTTIVDEEVTMVVEEPEDLE